MNEFNLSTPYFHSKLPWESGDKENTIFTGITILALVCTLTIALVVKITELPELPRA
jgi:hypothetical protein